jgi:hypothetical protein
MTEQSIIERAARALFESQPRIERWDDLDPNSKSIFLHKARKVIKAIREPSEAMIEVGKKRRVKDVREYPDRVEVDTMINWQAMIDAALAE